MTHKQAVGYSISIATFGTLLGSFLNCFMSADQMTHFATLHEGIPFTASTINHELRAIEGTLNAYTTHDDGYRTHLPGLIGNFLFAYLIVALFTFIVVRIHKHPN